MRENGGGPKGQGRVNDPGNRTDETAQPPRGKGVLKEPGVTWTRASMSREAIDARLANHLAELEEKGAPDIALVALEGAAGAVCNYIAWQGDIDAQAFHDE